jgi:hypothetical protein
MVSAYCQERANGVDPEKFMAHYESNGWRVGRTHMRDWKAAVRTWEKNGLSPANASGQYEVGPGIRAFMRAHENDAQ